MDFSKIDLKDHQVLARVIMQEAAKQTFKNRNEFQTFRNRFVKQYKGKIFHNLYFIQAYRNLVKEGLIAENQDLLNLIQKRSVRTMSGVAPVTVMTKPFPCPGKCIYCPTDVRMPKSYLPSQPAAQRAFRQQFDPYTQVFVRLKAMNMTGHETSKVELRVIGGTWSSYPKKYQTWFLKRCLQAMNEFHLHQKANKVDKTKKHLLKSPYGVDEVNTLQIRSFNKGLPSWSALVQENETAPVRCIGINIETRPDNIDPAEVRRLRYLGVTKVEIGVQTTDERVQEITKRGHDLKSVQKATALLKDAGFKIGYHMMPNLPGSTIEIDKQMITDLFKDDLYQPDYLKIYPCVVVQKSQLAHIYKKGGFQPYEDEVLTDVLIENLKAVPEWCRVDRLARDIPVTDLTAGFKNSNIRQIVEERLLKAGTPSRDIRSREIQSGVIHPQNIELVIRQYQASRGTEFFISYEDTVEDKIVALLRLRFPNSTIIAELKQSALIREVHVYGKQIAVGEKGQEQKQHMGWGTKLMQQAEKIALDAGYPKMAVIAGIGTREYYQKRGYELEGTYMLKKLSATTT